MKSLPSVALEQIVAPNLLEWAVERITADRILYGTDTPLCFAPMQRARIDFADMSEEDKCKILKYNAVAIFPAPGGLIRGILT